MYKLTTEHGDVYYFDSWHANTEKAWELNSQGIKTWWMNTVEKKRKRYTPAKPNNELEHMILGIGSRMGTHMPHRVYHDTPNHIIAMLVDDIIEKKAIERHRYRLINVLKNRLRSMREDTR